MILRIVIIEHGRSKPAKAICAKLILLLKEITRAHC
jgi:hypothetical protein